MNRGSWLHGVVADGLNMKYFEARFIKVLKVGAFNVACRG